MSDNSQFINMIGVCENDSRTIQGYEAMNMIRKVQVRCVSGNYMGRQVRFIEKLFDRPAKISATRPH